MRRRAALAAFSGGKSAPARQPNSSVGASIRASRSAVKTLGALFFSSWNSDSKPMGGAGHSSRLSAVRHPESGMMHRSALLDDGVDDALGDVNHGLPDPRGAAV